MENNYLGYEVINGVFVKDLSIEGEPIRLNKPYGYLLKNVNKYNVNARLDKLTEIQGRLNDEIINLVQYPQVRQDKEYEYLCAVDVIDELYAYRSTQDYCPQKGEEGYHAF